MTSYLSLCLKNKKGKGKRRKRCSRGAMATPSPADGVAFTRCIAWPQLSLALSVTEERRKRRGKGKERRRAQRGGFRRRRRPDRAVGAQPRAPHRERGERGGTAVALSLSLSAKGGTGRGWLGRAPPWIAAPPWLATPAVALAPEPSGRVREER